MNNLETLTATVHAARLELGIEYMRVLARRLLKAGTKHTHLIAYGGVCHECSDGEPFFDLVGGEPGESRVDYDDLEDLPGDADFDDSPLGGLFGSAAYSLADLAGGSPVTPVPKDSIYVDKSARELLARLEAKGYKGFQVHRGGRPRRRRRATIGAPASG